VLLHESCRPCPRHIYWLAVEAPSWGRQSRENSIPCSVCPNSVQVRIYLLSEFELSQGHDFLMSGRGLGWISAIPLDRSSVTVAAHNHHSMIPLQIPDTLWVPMTFPICLSHPTPISTNPTLRVRINSRHTKTPLPIIGGSRDSRELAPHSAPALSYPIAFQTTKIQSVRVNC
jgi:hypothetical protein